MRHARLLPVLFCTLLLLACSSEPTPDEPPPTGAEGPVQDWHRFKLELVGWPDADRDAIVRELGRAGFSDLRERGVAGDAAVYECVYQGELITARINRVLVKLELKHEAEVRKNRQRILIRKGGGS